MNIEKGRTLNGYAKIKVFKEIALTLVGGGYFTFTVNITKNTIMKIIILIMYFFIITTSFRRVA